MKEHANISHRANDLLLLMNSLGEKPETSLVKWNWIIHHEKDLSRISFFNQAYIERVVEQH